MKKIILVSLVLLTVLGGCGKETSPTDIIENKVITPAKSILSDFVSMANDVEKTTENLANEIMQNDSVNFTVSVMGAVPGTLSGFKNEITGFKKATVITPTLGTIPFIGYIFELEDKNDVEAFRTKLKDNADPEWNVNADGKAEEIVCEAIGNRVLFVMSPKSFDNITEILEKQTTVKR